MAMSMKSMSLTVGEKPEAMDSGDAKVGGRISTDRAVVFVCPMNCPRFQISEVGLREKSDVREHL